MFVFVSIILVFVAYIVSLKFVYYRFSQLWPHLRNKISTPSYTLGNAHFCPTQKRSGALLRNSDDGKQRVTANETRALLVTAHPDDECMFFAPTILKLVESQASVYLLCLSTGNYNNQGLQRKRELLDSCAVLGIPSNHVTVIEDKELPDDPAVQWSTALVSSLILKHTQNYGISLPACHDIPKESQAWRTCINKPENKAMSLQHDLVYLHRLASISVHAKSSRYPSYQTANCSNGSASYYVKLLTDLDIADVARLHPAYTHINETAIGPLKDIGDVRQVLTFDGRGVSGHANHIAIYKTLSYLASAGRLPEGCQIFSLHSISILRKYLSVLELPVSWLLPSDFCCLIGQKEYKRAKKAMLCHRSQLLWFRRLYIMFSRYMFINTFQAIVVETKNVKMY